MSNPIISIAMLREAGACAPELSRLESLFGSEITLTEDFALANAPLCDWDWAARNLLPASAWAEYKRAVASAWAEYKRAEAPAWAEYERARFRHGRNTSAPTAPAWAECKRAVALTFARLFIASTREKTDNE